MRSNARRRGIVVARQDVLEAFADLGLTIHLPTGRELDGEEVEHRMASAGITLGQIQGATVRMYS